MRISVCRRDYWSDMRYLYLFAKIKSSLVNVLLVHLTFSLCIILILTVLCSCSEGWLVSGPKRQLVSHDEHTIKVVYPLQVHISIDFGNIELYAWDKDEIKLETSAKLRGTGSEDKLKEGFKDFDLLINEGDSGIEIKSIYTGSVKSPADRSFDVKIYMPRTFVTLDLQLDTGKIKFFDDIKCDLTVQVNMANIDINRIEGTMEVEGDMCDLRVCHGELRSGSSVKVNFGHIRVKAKLDEAGTYNFETGTGNIELSLPEETKIDLDAFGTTDVKDFEIADDGIRIRAHTGMGNVSLNKY